MKPGLWHVRSDGSESRNLRYRLGRLMGEDAFESYHVMYHRLQIFEFVGIYTTAWKRDCLTHNS